MNDANVIEDMALGVAAEIAGEAAGVGQTGSHGNGFRSGSTQLRRA